MISRTTSYDGQSQVQLLDSDVGVIVDELNKGLDPTTFPQGKITSDKLRITTPTSPGGYSILQPGGVAAQINAGSQATLTVQVLSPIPNVGLSGGQYFPASIYADFFIDPTGAGAGAPSIAAIYTNGSVPGTGVSSKVICSAYLNNSVNTNPLAGGNANQLLTVTFQAHNFDTSSHWIYVAFTLCIINSASSTAQ